MVEILLFILKILGILLLSILAIVLLLILMLLFVPILYHIKVEYTASPRGEVDISWLPFTLHISYDEALQYDIRIFSRSIGSDKDIDGTESDDLYEYNQKDFTAQSLHSTSTTVSPSEPESLLKQELEDMQAGKPEVSETETQELENPADIQSEGAERKGANIKEQKANPEQPQIKETEKTKEAETIKEPETTNKTVQTTTKTKEATQTQETAKTKEAIKTKKATKTKETARTKKATKTKTKIKEKAKEKWKKIQAFFENISDKKEKLTKILNSRKNKVLLAFIWKKIKALWKCLAPKKSAGHIRFGFSDPATTGNALIYLSMLYPWLGRDISVIPEFEKEDMDIYLAIKGYFGLYYILYWVLSLFINKEFRKMVQAYRQKAILQYLLRD